MIKNIKILFYFTFIVVVIVVIKLADCLDIHPDEAYYFTWSDFLSNGYLDHPPAIAYIIKISSLIFDGNFSIRGLNIILSFLSLLFLGASIRVLWENEDIKYKTLIIVLLSPIFIAGSIITTPDTPLIFFISAYIYFSIIDKENDRFYIQSIIAGISLGLAMLSKYTGFFIILSLFIFYLRFRKDSSLIKRKVLIPIIISFITYLPNLVYNIRNEYRSYLFQISHAISNPVFNPVNTLIPFVLSQVFILSPFFIFFFIIKVDKWRRDNNPRTYLLFALSIVPLMFFLLLSLFKHIEANWAAFAFIPLSLLVSVEIGKSLKRFLVILAYHIIVFILIVLHTTISIFPIKPDKDPLTQIKYWERTYKMITENIPQERTLVTFRYQLSSVLYFYSNKKITSLCMDKRFVTKEIGLKEADKWVMIDFFPAKIATDIVLNICPDRIVRIPLVISENMNIIRRVDIIYCGNLEKSVIK